LKGSGASGDESPVPDLLRLRRVHGHRGRRGVRHEGARLLGEALERVLGRVRAPGQVLVLKS